ncbi:hypothetical protein GF373_06545, partial [bacterium]|nr:hypothetical protein [bacterium]
MNKRSISFIHSEILAFCQKHADADQAARYARYFKEGYDAYGIPREIFEQQTQLFL